MSVRVFLFGRLFAVQAIDWAAELPRKVVPASVSFSARPPAVTASVMVEDLGPAAPARTRTERSPVRPAAGARR